MRSWKKIFLLLVCALMLTGCRKSSEDAAREFGLEKTSSSTEDDEYIRFVQEGHPTKIPGICYGEAFEDFFGNPTWEYFLSDDGEDVVEFTGECTYRNAEVKASLQFILSVEEGSFEYGALNFNGVPQTDIITSLMIYTAFKDYADANNIDIDDSDEDDFSIGTETYLGDEDDMEDDETEQNDEEFDYTDEEDEEPYSDNYYEEENDNYEDEEDEEYDSSDDAEYICPYSDTVKLTKKEVKALSNEERRFARNEIYARHGRRFSDPSLQEYFDSKEWYVPMYDPEEFSDSLLNKVEKYNVKLIKKYE